jgi:hypothetical protein
MVVSTLVSSNQILLDTKEWLQLKIKDFLSNACHVMIAPYTMQRRHIYNTNMPHLWSHQWQGREDCLLPAGCSMEKRHEWYQVCLGPETPVWGSFAPSGELLYSDLPQQVQSPEENKHVLWVVYMIFKHTRACMLVAISTGIFIQ